MMPPIVGSPPNAGGSKARNCWWRASRFSTSDSGVPQRAVITSSDGS
jgi:hypothetical protein